MQNRTAFFHRGGAMAYSASVHGRKANKKTSEEKTNRAPPFQKHLHSSTVSPFFRHVIPLARMFYLQKNTRVPPTVAQSEGLFLMVVFRFMPFGIQTGDIVFWKSYLHRVFQIHVSPCPATLRCMSWASCCVP